MSQPTNPNSEPGKNLDDLFRDALGKQEYTPSHGLWRNLSWKLLLRELMRFNFTNVPNLALFSVSGGLILTAALTYLALNSDSAIKTSAVANPQSISKEYTSSVNTAQSQPSVRTVSLPEAQAVIKSVAELKSVKPSPPSPKLNPNEGALLATSARVEKFIPSAPPVNTNDFSNTKTTISAADSKLESLDPLEFSSFDLKPSTDTLSFTRSGEVFKYVREKIPVPSFFSVTAGISPEMALYRSNGTSTREFNYWANAGIAYHYSRFSVSTGIGLGYTYDEGSYSIQYRSNDSVSYYKEVTGYYVEPGNPSNIIYITRNHAIYDSVTHIADDRTRNRYAYLQVPLLIGYSLIETPRFSMGIEAGPAISFLINEKKAQPVIDIPGGRLIKLEDYSPSRLPTNWQLWVKLSISYQFTKNWGIMFNPYYKYFLTSPTQSAESGNRTTQAFGIDIGIQYLFGRKSPKK